MVSSSSNFKFRWKTDLDKQTIIGAFEKRGWTRAVGEEDWNVYWALPHNAKGKFFSPDSGLRLNEY